MKITDVRIRILRCQVRHPFTNSLGKAIAHAVENSIVEVHTDEGVVGVVGSPMIDRLCRHIILNHVKPLIVGEDPMNYERVWRKMFGEEKDTRPTIAKGEFIRAMSVVDSTMWDIIGKKLGMPVYKLLGGFRDQIPCYASGGHYLHQASRVEELKNLDSEMSQYVNMGFKAVKMRVGRNIAEDIERVRVVRGVIGPNVDLMIDFNTSQTYRGGAPYAIKFMRALEKYDPFWFEDPLVMDDIAGMKEVSSAMDISIATGENEQTVWGFRDLIVNKAVDILLPDATQMCGGITEWRKIAALADAFRMPVAAHIGTLTHVHCVAAVPNGLTVEVFRPLDEDRRMYEVDPVMPNKEGLIEVPQKPGFGIVLNEEYIKKHIVA